MSFFFFQDNSTTDPQTPPASNTTDRDCNVLSAGAVLLADVVPSLLITMSAPFLLSFIRYDFIFLFRNTGIGMVRGELNDADFASFQTQGGDHGPRQLLQFPSRVPVRRSVASDSRSRLRLGQLRPRRGHSAAVLGQIPQVRTIQPQIGMKRCRKPAAEALTEVTFPSRNIIASWSSGTGGAGLFASLLYATLTAVLKPRSVVLIMLFVPFLMAFSFFVVLEHKKEPTFVDDQKYIRRLVLIAPSDPY